MSVISDPTAFNNCDAWLRLCPKFFDQHYHPVAERWDLRPAIELQRVTDEAGRYLSIANAYDDGPGLVDSDRPYC